MENGVREWYEDSKDVREAAQNNDSITRRKKKLPKNDYQGVAVNEKKEIEEIKVVLR